MRITSKCHCEEGYCVDYQFYENKKTFYDMVDYKPIVCNNIITKLGMYEDIDDRLAKYNEDGINLVALFKNLTDEDIEAIVKSILNGGKKKCK